MASAKSTSTGLGMVSEGLETSREDLPPWEAQHIKTYPLCWKNPVTAKLHLQAHPSGIETLIIDPLPSSAPRTEASLYPDGAHITDLKQARDLLYSLQRPAIAPRYVYTHEWAVGDLALFHNRGVLHSITGAFAPEVQRAFWQCNLASSDKPVGPSEEDLKTYA